MQNKFYYITPVFAFLGLFTGLVLHALGYENLDHTAWMATMFVGTLPILYKILKDVFSGRFGIDIIAITAIVVSFLLKEYLAGNVILLMLSGGEALETFALKRARKELANLISNAPTTAHIKRGDVLTEIDAHEIKINDVILVKPGEIVAADGVVILGKSQVDESALTGEGIPVEKEVGSMVLSGSINKGAVLEVRVLKPASESKYEQIIKLIREAEEDRAPVVRLADRYSVWFTVVTFVIAVFAWFISKDAVRVLSVLVVATPCPLILATPIAMISGISKSAKRGIIVKNGGALENLAESNAFIFDKTGTLTLGQPEIVKLVPFSTYEKDLLRISASLDQLSLHVLARSLKNYAEKNNAELAIPDNFEEIFGEGVCGDLGDKRYCFGRLSFLEKMGVKVSPDLSKEHENYQNNGQIAVYLGEGLNVLGVVVFADVVRPEMKNVFSNLRDQGLEHLVMLTGDKKAVAEIIANELGLDDVHAEALPEDKVYEVKDHKKQFGKVAMVGDGINDAPALAVADVGIALGGHGGSASSDSGDIVVTVDDLSRVAEAHRIAKHVLKVAKQGIFFGIGGSVVLMFVASFGYIPPVYGALIQEGLDVIVILNALRVSFMR